MGDDEEEDEPISTTAATMPPMTAAAAKRPTAMAPPPIPDDALVFSGRRPLGMAEYMRKKGKWTGIRFIHSDRNVHIQCISE